MDQTPFECFSYIQQEFLVCVSVHKAKNLSAFNASTYVKVTLDKKNRKTKVFPTSENPYFNEYFVFELKCTLAELQCQTLFLEVKKAAFCKKVSIGELLIDLAIVWNQPGHSFLKKWGKLADPFGKEDDVHRGHLQIDVCIVSRHMEPTPALSGDVNYDDIEKNLLQLNGEGELNKVRYIVEIIRGIFIKKSDYSVEVSFAGLKSKTRVIKNTVTPVWCEGITFTWAYPSLCQTLQIRVLSSERLLSKCILEYDIHFDEIHFQGELPTLGPTYLQLYNNSAYIGRILINISSETVTGSMQSPQRMVILGSVPLIDEKIYWVYEEFIIDCLIWTGDFIHNNSRSIKFSIECGETKSDYLNCVLTTNPVTRWGSFKQNYPQKAIRIQTLLPDCRSNFEADQFWMNFIQSLTTQMENFRLLQIRHPGNTYVHGECLKTLLLLFEENLKEGKRRIKYNGFKRLTNWETNRLKFLEDFHSNFLKQLKKAQDISRESNLNNVIDELRATVNTIETVMLSRIHDNWPDLVLNLWAGGSIVAICKLRAKNYFYSERMESMGNFCGKRHSLVFKPVKCLHTCKYCGCIYAKVDAWIWIGTEREQKVNPNKEDWMHKENNTYEIKQESNFKCQLYINQAKVRPGFDSTGLVDAYIRATLFNVVGETSTISETLSPIWKETLVFENVLLPGSALSYVNNPIIVALEVWDADTKSSAKYVGCGLVKLAVKRSNAQILDDDTKKPKTFENIKIYETFKKILRGNKKLQNAAQTLKFLDSSPPPLVWVPISYNGVVTVEILMSGELIEAENIGADLEVKIIKSLPKEISLKNKEFRIEVIFAGIRNFRKIGHTSTAGRYKIVVMVADALFHSGVSGSRIGESINFLDPYATSIINLPEQVEYWPPIIITHVDISKRKLEVTVGAALISNSGKYFHRDTLKGGERADTAITGLESSENLQICIPKTEATPLLNTKGSALSRKTSIFPRIFGANKQIDIDNEQLNVTDADGYSWWTKYYNSINNAQNQDVPDGEDYKHRLVIFPSELEKQPEYSFLKDWAEPIQLVHGMKKKKNEPIIPESYCVIKLQISIKNTESVDISKSAVINPKFKFEEIESLTQEVSVVVRVYVVQGIKMISRDRNNPSDCYVKLQFGNQKISDRANYVANQANPVFGRRFQLEGVIPREHILYISVYDHDLFDELIGSTCIDIEDRLRTKHRGTIGLANEYSRTGYNVWRDSKTPFQILEDVCRKHDLSPPKISGNKIMVGGITFQDSTKLAVDEDIKERLSLSVLKRLDEIPQIGYKLIPEYVETRSLYCEDRPSVEQEAALPVALTIFCHLVETSSIKGKIQLWVEIFYPGQVPPPINIIPTPPAKYEVRVNIYNTSDVLLTETSVLGNKMSDIYVKGWIADVAQAQSTDIHFRSLNGEGNFNWRMIFPMIYSKVEDMMVVNLQRAFFEKNDTEIKMPPILNLQIWDNDSISADDFIGSLHIHLSHLPEPFPTSKKCTLNTEGVKFINLFKTEQPVKGWLAAKGLLEDGTIGLAGKVELEIEVLTEFAALEKPAGLGREGPNALPEPNRPDTSFKWYTDPLKTFRHIIKPALKKLCWYLLIGGVTLLFLPYIIYFLIGLVTNPLY